MTIYRGTEMPAATFSLIYSARNRFRSIMKARTRLRLRIMKRQDLKKISRPLFRKGKFRNKWYTEISSRRDRMNGNIGTDKKVLSVIEFRWLLQSFFCALHKHEDLIMKIFYELRRSQKKHDYEWKSHFYTNLKTISAPTPNDTHAVNKLEYSNTFMRVTLPC